MGMSRMPEFKNTCVCFAIKSRLMFILFCLAENGSAWSIQTNKQECSSRHRMQRLCLVRLIRRMAQSAGQGCARLTTYSWRKDTGQKSVTLQVISGSKGGVGH